MRRWALCLFAFAAAVSVYPHARELTPQATDLLHVMARNAVFSIGVDAPLVLVCIDALLFKANWRAFADWLTRPAPLFVAVTMAVTMMPVLLVLRLPGFFWTWGTAGLHLSACLLIYACVRDQVGNFRALVVAGGAYGLTAGIWEVIDQGGYVFHYPYDLPLGQAPAILASVSEPARTSWLLWIWQTWRVLPLIVGGVAAMLTIRQARPSRATLLLALVFVSLIGYWFWSGFPVDTRVDANGQLYLGGTATVWDMTLQKVAKVVFALVFISMYGQWSLRLSPLVAQMVRYSIVGGTGVAISLGLTWLLSDRLHLMHHLVAQMFGIAGAITSNFIGHKFYSFRETSSTGKGVPHGG